MESLDTCLQNRAEQMEKTRNSQGGKKGLHTQTLPPRRGSRDTDRARGQCTLHGSGTVGTKHYENIKGLNHSEI